MLMVAVVFSTGCKKDPDNGGNNNGGGNGGGNGGNSNPIPEGIYLGIIGFNQHLYEKEISLLKASTKESFISHINGLETRDGTGLYWADNTALMRLKSFGEPKRLTTVALVTFTDGLDNVSLDDNVTNPDNYPTKEAYLEGLSGKIRQDKVYNKDITAYTIGLRGNDVNDVDEFHANIKKLASEDGNGIEVSDMNHALQKFTEIAESLHSVTFTASLTLLIPPGYDDGQIVRFTFDDIPSTSTAAENSTSYIECTYKRTEDGRRLENITYHGWQPGSSSVSSFEKVDRYYKVAFENLTKTNGNLISNDDKRYLQLFYKTPSGIWQKDSEFKPDTFSNVIEEQSSALILLVLDCTTSLGSEFSSLKNAAKQFVETLVRSNSGGSNGGGGNGGGSSQYYDISVSANPNNGGTVSGGGSYQQGQTCTLSAIPASGYTFVKWTENGSQVSTNVNYTFTVTGDRSLVANFNYNGGSNAPTGAIDGLFTINSNGNQVYFSKGNLQYKASNGTWRFATNQWDYVGTQTPDQWGCVGGTVEGSDNRYISETYNGWIDLLGWGTSGWNCGNTYYYPWDSDDSCLECYGPYGNNNLTGSFANSDWGFYNSISNGGNQSHQWRTLTLSEWDYVINQRTTTSGIRYAKAVVNTVQGMILLPDNWSASYYSLGDTNNGEASFDSNIINSSTWINSLQAHGAVFLPTTGYRLGPTRVDFVNVVGYYWSASHESGRNAYNLMIQNAYIQTDDSYFRCAGFSVRLVCPAQ